MVTANPECSDSRISEILMESWDNLSVSEKTTYELKAGAQSLEKGSVLLFALCVFEEHSSDNLEDSLLSCILSTKFFLRRLYFMIYFQKTGSR